MSGPSDLHEAERVEYIQQEGELLDGGITNEVYELGDSIGKIYSRVSWNIALPTLYRALYRDIDILTRDKRMQNEEDALAYMEDVGFRTPELEEIGERYAVWEKIEGENELAELDTETIYEASREVGENLHELHENDAAVTDTRYENFFYTTDEVTSIDHEMFREDAAVHDKNLDIYMWVSSIKRLDEDRYRAARDGFFDGYGGTTTRRTGVLTTGMAVGHALVELDGEGLRNSVSNALDDAVNRIQT